MPPAPLAVMDTVPPVAPASELLALPLAVITPLMPLAPTEAPPITHGLLLLLVMLICPPPPVLAPRPAGPSAWRSPVMRTLPLPAVPAEKDRIGPCWLLKPVVKAAVLTEMSPPACTCRLTTGTAALPTVSWEEFMAMP